MPLETRAAAARWADGRLTVWAETRSENLVGMVHGRGQRQTRNHDPTERAESATGQA